VIIVLALIWTLAASAFLVAWSNLNSHVRCLEGIDEAAHIDGRAD
jgi:hypothetical protein